MDDVFHLVKRRQPVRVTMVKAIDLPAKAAAICQCKVSGKPHTLISTVAAKSSKNPEWNHTGDLVDYVMGESLEFQLCENTLLRGLVSIGKVDLSTTSFIPKGFEGLLDFTVKGKSKAKLSVKIELLDSSLRRLPSDFIYDNLAGAAESTNRRVFVTIASLAGMRAKHWLSDNDTYCTCEIPDKPKSRFQTAVAQNNNNPTWSCTSEVRGYQEGDWLRFCVWDWDRHDQILLGRTVLAPEQFFPYGFVGDVLLLAPGRKLRATSAILRIRVVIHQQDTQLQMSSNLAPFQFLELSKEAVTLLAEREKALASWQSQAESLHEDREAHILAEAQALSSEQDAVQKKHLELLVATEELWKKDLLTRADAAYAATVDDLWNSLQEGEAAQAKVRKLADEEIAAMRAKQDELIEHARQQEQSLEKAHQNAELFAEQAELLSQSEIQFDEERRQLADWECQLRTDWNNLQAAVVTDAQNEGGLVEWATNIAAAQVHSSVDVFQREVVVGPSVMYYVAWQLTATSDVDGKSFNDLPNANRCFDRQLPRCFAVMLMGHNFKEICYNGPADVMEDFRAWWQLVRKEHVKPAAQISASEPYGRWAQAWRALGKGQDDLTVMRGMLEADLKLVTLSKFAKEASSTLELQDLLLPTYSALLASYRSFLITGTTSCASPGLGLSAFLIFLGKCGLLGNGLTPTDVLQFAVSSSAISSAAIYARVRPSNPDLCPLLTCRYQFLELLLHIARLRFANHQQGGLNILLKSVADESRVLLRQEIAFLEAFFIQEVDDVLELHKDVLRGVYELYASHQIEHAGVQALSFTAWSCLVRDCRAFASDVQVRCARAFGMGAMWQVEDTSLSGSARLGLVEFLLAIGAVVFLQDHWHASEFADLLDEFVEVHLLPILQDKPQWSSAAVDRHASTSIASEKQTQRFAYECEAREKDSDLGLEFWSRTGHKSASSGNTPLIVDKVKTKSWAAAVGVAAGDELYQVGGQRVAGLSPEQVKLLMMSRPVRLVFIHKPKHTVDMDIEDWAARFLQRSWRRRRARQQLAAIALRPDFGLASGFKVGRRLRVEVVVVASASGPLGFVLEGFAPRRVYVREVQLSTWADSLGIWAGCEVLAVAGRMVWWMKHEELVQKLQRRPVCISFGCQPWRKDGFGGAVTSMATPASLSQAQDDSAARAQLAKLANTDDVFDLVAQREDKELGVSFSPLPPEQALCQNIVPNSWAALKGLQVGDELVSVNGKLIGSMTKKEFDKVIGKRPLQFSYRRVQTPLMRKSLTRGALLLSKLEANTTPVQALAGNADSPPPSTALPAAGARSTPANQEAGVESADTAEADSTAESMLTAAASPVPPLSDPLPQPAKKVAKLNVKIVGATGLRAADGVISGKSDAFCTCQIAGKPKSLFQTEVIKKTLNPTWNHSQLLNNVALTDRLNFQVYDWDNASASDSLGHITLQPSQFFPEGFDGEVDLLDDGKGKKAMLKIKIDVLSIAPDPTKVEKGGTSAEKPKVEDISKPTVSAVAPSRRRLRAGLLMQQLATSLNSGDKSEATGANNDALGLASKQVQDADDASTVAPSAASVSAFTARSASSRAGDTSQFAP